MVSPEVSVKVLEVEPVETVVAPVNEELVARCSVNVTEGVVSDQETVTPTEGAGHAIAFKFVGVAGLGAATTIAAFDQVE